MEKLEIIDLYDDSNKQHGKEFIDKTKSELNVKINEKKITRDLEWIDIMNFTIPYIDNIFRTPNRFIVNEEEIVKIEQARKVTVETIKHLSKNTNFIQTVDKRTGDVTPSKLLNVRKEETYNTYENRLIYTLMKNMKLFLNRRKESLTLEISAINKKDKNKSIKAFDFQANTKLKEEKIDTHVKLNVESDNSGEKAKENVEKILREIAEIERKILGLESTEVYRILEKEKPLLVREPVKKTNVILKNVNFQYAMKLWDYLRDNFDDKTKVTEIKKDYNDSGEMKHMMNEAFLLQYLVMKTLDEDEEEKKETKQEIQDIILEQMIDKMLDLNLNLKQRELKQLIATRYEILKYKKLEVIQELQKEFKKHIDDYIRKVEKK